MLVFPKLAALIGMALWTALAGQPQSQPTTASAPRFEVASIKLNKSGDLYQNPGLPTQGKRFAMTNMPLQFLVTLAFGLKDSELSGAPSWLHTERYDVEAEAGTNISPEDLRPEVQTLLEDRLQLKWHRATRTLPIYVLTVAEAGKLHRTGDDCGPLSDSPSPPPSFQPDRVPAPPCGYFFAFPGHLRGQKLSPAGIADLLSAVTDRKVLDKTGLTGNFDVRLDYTPEQISATPPGVFYPPIDPNGPSLFSAVNEQLGLKLESQKGPVEIVVIDHVERPSEN